MPRRRVALRTALTLFVMLSVLSTALLIHLSWSRTARDNVVEVARQLNSQIANSIGGKLGDIQRNAAATQEAVRSIFVQGAITPLDEGKREFIFLALLQAQPELSWVAFGWPTGEFFGAEKVSEDLVQMVEVVWNPLLHQAKRRTDRYIPEPGEPRFIDRTYEPTTYSVQDQKWYREAIHKDSTVWTQTTGFPGRQQPGINISGKLILYGRFIGVIDVTIELGRLSHIPGRDPCRPDRHRRHHRRGRPYHRLSGTRPARGGGGGQDAQPQFPLCEGQPAAGRRSRRPGRQPDAGLGV